MRTRIQILIELFILSYASLAIYCIFKQNTIAAIVPYISIYQPHSILVLIWVSGYFLFEKKFERKAILVLIFSYCASEGIVFLSQLFFERIVYEGQRLTEPLFGIGLIASFILLRPKLKITKMNIGFPILYFAFWAMWPLEGYSNTLFQNFVGNVLWIVTCFTVLDASRKQENRNPDHKEAQDSVAAV